MIEKKYKVLEGTHILAENMELQYALIFMKALCEEFPYHCAYYILEEQAGEE